MEIDQTEIYNLFQRRKLPTPSRQQLPESSDSGSSGCGDYGTHPTISSLDAAGAQRFYPTSPNCADPGQMDTNL